MNSSLEQPPGGAVGAPRGSRAGARARFQTLVCDAGGRQVQAWTSVRDRRRIRSGIWHGQSELRALGTGVGAASRRTPCSGRLGASRPHCTFAS